MFCRSIVHANQCNTLLQVHSAAPLTLDMEMCAMARKIVLNYASRGKSDGKPSSHSRDRTVAEGDKLCSETLLYTEGWPGRTYMTGRRNVPAR